MREVVRTGGKGRGATPRGAPEYDHGQQHGSGVLLERAAEGESGVRRLRIHHDHVWREITDAAEVLLGEAHLAHREDVPFILRRHPRQYSRALAGCQHV